MASYKFKVELKSHFVINPDFILSDTTAYHELTHKNAIEYLVLDLPSDICLQEYIAYKLQYEYFKYNEELKLTEYETECAEIDTLLANVLINRIRKKKINFNDFRQ